MNTEKNAPNTELTLNQMDIVAGGKGASRTKGVDPEKAAMLEQIRNARSAGLSCDAFITSLAFPEPLSGSDSAKVSFIRYWWNRA